VLLLLCSNSTARFHAPSVASSPATERKLNRIILSTHPIEPRIESYCRRLDYSDDVSVCTYLETCSQSGPLSAASLKAASISDRILSSASVSCLGHRFPAEPPAAGRVLPAALGSSAAGRLLMGDVVPAPAVGENDGAGMPGCCCCMLCVRA
jgi:hypothetical protein